MNNYLYKMDQFIEEYRLTKNLNVEIKQGSQIYATDHFTGRGIRGYGLLLAVIKNQDPKKWSWGYTLPSFPAIIAEKRILSRWLTLRIPKLSPTVIGDDILLEKSTEIFLRAICTDIFDLKFICEFVGPTGDRFVLGIKNATRYNMPSIMHKRLQKVITSTRSKNKRKKMGIRTRSSTLKFIPEIPTMENVVTHMDLPYLDMSQLEASVESPIESLTRPSIDLNTDSIYSDDCMSSQDDYLLAHDNYTLPYCSYPSIFR